jgi:outer membrane protein OmpA-like peptidoglycan-associated protein
MNRAILLLILGAAMPAAAFAQQTQDCHRATELVIQAFDIGQSPASFPEQKRLLNQALAICPDHPEAHNNLASILEEERQYDQALRHYRRAVEAKPDFAVAWYGVGEVYVKTGRFPLALEAYLRACHEDADARKRIRELLDSNRYSVTEAGEILDKESLLLLFDKNRRDNIRKMISDCGFRANVVPEVTFRNLLFETGSAELQPESIPQIREIGEALKAIHQTVAPVNVRVAGHTDRQPFKGFSQAESDRMNMKLSRDRAASVARQLARMGIARDKIQTEGYGPNRPAVDGDTPEAYEKNRRVVLEVSE